MPRPSSTTVNLTLERCSWSHTVQKTIVVSAIQNDSFWTVQTPYEIQGVRISRMTREELIPRSQQKTTNGYWRIRQLSHA